MPPTMETRRLCPYCGENVNLAACPIVATNREADVILRDLIEKGEWSSDGVPATGHATTEVESRLDGESRAVLFGPPANLVTPNDRGRLRELIAPSLAAALPDPFSLTRDIPVLGLDPRRACTRCNHPLPLELDDRHASTIVVAGISRASKSTLLTRLCRLAEAGGSFTDVGFREFVELEESPEEINEMAAEIQRGGRLNPTEPPRLGAPYLPWMFLVTGARKQQPYLLNLHDVAGESFQNRSLRGRQAPFLAWADAVVFLVDPEPYLDPGVESARWNQARVIQGVLTATRRTDVPVAVALAKADLVGYEGSADVADESSVVATLRSIGAGMVIDATSGHRNVSFHAVAAQPDNSMPSFGVVEVFASVATRGGLI